MTFHLRARISYPFICLCLLFTVALGIIVSCKQKAPRQAIAIFVIGDVKLQRPGEQERLVKHKDILLAKDIIKTGPEAIMVFQIGTETLIKIDPNTQVFIASVMKKGDIRLELGQGKMFSNIRDLGKGDSFQVRMKTSVAAVRGTEFSTEQTNKASIVAVSRGTIAVRKLDEKNKTKEEKSIQTGNAAVVKGNISTRPLTPNEGKELALFDKITPVEDIEDKSESELKNMENNIMGNREVSKPIDAKKAGKKAITTEGAVWTGKQVYGPSEVVVVNYKDMPESGDCWISVSKAGSADISYESFNWTYSAKDGQMAFQNLKLEPGNYEVRVHFSRGNEVSLRYSFQIK